MTLPEQIVSELRKRGEKRIKSVFYNPDNGSLSVFLKEPLLSPLPVGKKSFNYTPLENQNIIDLVDEILLLAKEILNRSDLGQYNQPSEEEYEGERTNNL